MTFSLLRTAIMIGGCTGVVACSQQAAQYGPPDVQTQVTRRARLCIAEGKPGSAGFTDSTWAITVSSEGGPCPHTRDLGGSDQAYQVLQAPRHGRITQESQAGKTVVSYWPDPRYVGSDSFALRYPTKR